MTDYTPEQLAEMDRQHRDYYSNRDPIYSLEDLNNDPKPDELRDNSDKTMDDYSESVRSRKIVPSNHVLRMSPCPSTLARFESWRRWRARSAQSDTLIG